jgi:hypothetical protein
MASGVPTGATSASQPRALKPGSVSAAVGRSGKLDYIHQHKSQWLRLLIRTEGFNPLIADFINDIDETRSCR